MHIQMHSASDPRVSQFIDIQVVDIPVNYGMLLSRDWSKTLNGYMATDFSHMWLPWRGVPNQIRIEAEPRMKHMITEYNRTNKILYASVEPASNEENNALNNFSQVIRQEIEKCIEQNLPVQCKLYKNKYRVHDKTHPEANCSLYAAKYDLP